MRTLSFGIPDLMNRAHTMLDLQKSGFRVGANVAIFSAMATEAFINDMPPTRLTLVAWLIALVGITSSCAYGDDAKNETPLLEVKWTPFFDKGYVVLSITNRADHVVEVFPGIQPEFYDPRFPVPAPARPTALKDGFGNAVIVPIIVFTAAPKDWCIEGGGGGGIGFVNIAPSETKVIKLEDSSLMSMAKFANKVTFSLSMDGLELAKSKVVMTNLADKWQIHN